jgi:ribosomal protein L11 methyltransferase
LWPALDIHVPGCDPTLRELVLAELDDYQPTAIDEPEENAFLRAFFTTREVRQQAADGLRAAFGSHVFVEPVDVEDDDWAARSQAALHAVTVGRVVVTPPWEKMGSDPIQPDRVQVVIQPSMGFGTGHHATTRLMLAALQRIDLENRVVLDVGCGSGVLAIAAVRLGAGTALAVDNDPDALASAAENVELNGVGDRVRLRHDDLSTLSSPADVVVANLTGALLERSAATLSSLVAPNGYLIVSGVMASETTVIPALQAMLVLERVDQEDEWMCATLQRAQDSDQDSGLRTQGSMPRTSDSRTSR